MHASGRLFCYALTEDAWVIGGAVSNGGIAARWAGGVFGHGRQDGQRLGDVELLELAASVPAGSDGLVMLPHLLAERAPLWDPDLAVALPRHQALAHSRPLRACRGGGASRSSSRRSWTTSTGSTPSPRSAPPAGSSAALCGDGWWPRRWAPGHRVRERGGLRAGSRRLGTARHGPRGDPRPRPGGADTPLRRDVWRDRGGGPSGRTSTSGSDRHCRRCCRRTTPSPTSSPPRRSGSGAQAIPPEAPGR